MSGDCNAEDRCRCWKGETGAKETEAIEEYGDDDEEEEEEEEEAAAAAGGDGGVVVTIGTVVTGLGSSAGAKLLPVGDVVEDAEDDEEGSAVEEVVAVAVR